jgi:hypothetical protein
MFRNHKKRPVRRPSPRAAAVRVEQMVNNPNFKYEVTRSL